MPQGLFSEITTYVGFTDADAHRVRALAPIVQPAIPQVVQRFYDVLTAHPQASQVFTGGEAQIARQQRLLANWLSEVFNNPVDETYFKSRFQIGVVHVNVGLPQRFMLLGMEVVRQELSGIIRAAKPPQVDAKLESLHKLLTMDLAVMVESYHVSDAERIRTTERNLVAAQLLRAEHLAEIGQLAASLAHEIKNPLAGISGAIQIMASAMAADDPHREVFKEIMLQIGRMDATVKDLLTYARPSPPSRRELKLDSLVERVLVLLKHEPDLQRVKVQYESTNGEALVFADDAQMEQLLMNLILNAAHASPEGSVIEVTGRPMSFYTQIVVTDYGHGMKPAVLERALEPFFTTKAKGTGLGLAICRRIAESHGGTIRLSSEVGKGTTVTIELPRGHASAAKQ